MQEERESSSFLRTVGPIVGSVAAGSLGVGIGSTFAGVSGDLSVMGSLGGGMAGYIVGRGISSLANRRRVPIQPGRRIQDQNIELQPVRVNNPVFVPPPMDSIVIVGESGPREVSIGESILIGAGPNPNQQVIIMNPVAYLKKGGKAKKTGIYGLHKGEVVIPANRVKSVDRSLKKNNKKPLKKC